MAPLPQRPAAPAGVRESSRAGPKDGPLTGANVQHDANLYRLLFTLSELSAKPKYSNAAAAALTFFLNRAASPATHLLPWGEHLAWDVFKDEPVGATAEASGLHEFSRAWLLWDRCFELAPAGSRQFALGLWEHHVDPRTGAVARQSAFAKHAPGASGEHLDVPRHAGFCIRTWATAYAHTRDEQFLRAIEKILARLEGSRHPISGWLPARAGYGQASVGSSLSLAVDCDGSSRLLPEPLRSRLRSLANQEDALFCALPHRLKETQGFINRVELSTGRPTSEVTAVWQERDGERPTAQMAMLCVSRYDNTGKVGYRDLIHAAAEVYRSMPPDTSPDLWPGTLGHVISLQVAAWQSTARSAHLERARELGRFALDRFFDGSPLPRASLSSQHYETITGADTLALALVELHLQVLHITAVRCPPNTIDR